jgi:hypothetical protein
VNTYVTYKIGYVAHPGLRCVLPILCLTAMFSAGLARAGEADRRLLINYISNSPPCESLAETNSVPVNTTAASTNDDRAVRKVQAPHNELTSGDRWEKFETDFGVSDKDPSLVKGSLESAKYQLDRTLFGMKEFVQEVSFDYELRNMGGTPCPATHSGPSSAPISLWDCVEQARFKSDINMNVLDGGGAFLGVRLVLPIGN